MKINSYKEFCLFQHVSRDLGGLEKCIIKMHVLKPFPIKFLSYRAHLFRIQNYILYLGVDPR